MAKKSELMKPSYKIAMPPLWIATAFAAVAAVVKLLGMTQHDWLDVLLAYPAAIYVGICFTYGIMAMLLMLVNYAISEDRMQKETDK